jgi:uncharacterized membrane protein YkoI
MRQMITKKRILAAGISTVAAIGIATAGAALANANEVNPTETTTPSLQGAETPRPRGHREGRTPREQIDPATVSVTQAAAEAAAETSVGGGEATRASLRHNREGIAVWRVTVVNGETRTKVTLDANTGAVLSTREGTVRTHADGESRSRRRGRRGNNGTGTGTADATIGTTPANVVSPINNI